jgi:hypothetical protein
LPETFGGLLREFSGGIPNGERGPEGWGFQVESIFSFKINV